MKRTQRHDIAVDITKCKKVYCNESPVHFIYLLMNEEMTVCLFFVYLYARNSLIMGWGVIL